MDERLNDAAIDFAVAAPHSLVALMRRAFMTTHACEASAPTPCRRQHRPINISAPIATCCRALIAS
eukprot:4217686-Pleurochrysis_carterae.AAC.1